MSHFIEPLLDNARFYLGQSNWNELPAAGIKYIDNFKNFQVNLKSMLQEECWST